MQEEISTKEYVDTKTITSYLVRCTSEQKEFLQKKIVESGQAAAQFLVDAATIAAQKNTENVFLEDELAEVDSLMARLNRIIKAKVYVACEKEKQLDDELKNAESELAERRKALELEYSEKEQFEQNRLQAEKETLEKQFSEEKSTWETAELRLKEELQSLQEKYAQKMQESYVREKQYADSVKLHQNIEERNVELKNMNDELKAELAEFKKLKENAQFIEKERDELKSRIELLNAIHEQELKNLQGEFALKAQILTHEVEKKYLTPVPAMVTL
jgi:chromosome segregation ATPase